MLPKSSEYQATHGNKPVLYHTSGERPISFFLLRSQLGRQGRALCRLLYKEGRPASEIAGIIGVSTETVLRSIRNGYATKDKIADDYHLVGDDLIAKYKITPPSRSTTRREEMQPSVCLISSRIRCD